MSDEHDLSTTNNPDTMTRKRYVGFSLPEGLKDEIDRLLKELESQGIDLGYSSTTEFLREAIRAHIARIRENHLRK